MTEEMKYYTGNCITDLHTDTSISSNEEKCKQYIKLDGLNFCMSSVCPEKDFIYALVNKLYQKIDCLEQERNELQDKYSKLIHKYNDLYEKYRAKEILEPDLKEEIKRFDALNIKYSQALEEINIIVKNYCNACDEFKVKTYKNKNDCLYCNYGFIKNKINEVLNA